MSAATIAPPKSNGLNKIAVPGIVKDPSIPYAPPHSPGWEWDATLGVFLVNPLALQELLSRFTDE